MPQAKIQGPVVDRATAWQFVGDTDALNRTGGNGAVRELRIEPDGNGGSRVVGEMDGPMGTRMRFEEIDNAWVEGRFFRQHRVFEKSPAIRESLYVAELVPTGDGVAPHLRLDLEAANPLAYPAISLAVRQIGTRWQRAANRLVPAATGPSVDPRVLPSAARDAYDRWAPLVDPALAERVWTHLCLAPHLELQRMRVFGLADAWSLSRRDTANAALTGVESGLFELYWSVRCDRCYGQVASSPILSDIADHAACPSCRIAVDVDLSTNVECLFAPHPAVVPRIEETFCSLFPAGAPELHGSFVLQPGSELREAIALPLGRWRVGAGGDAPDLDVHVVPDGATTTVDWEPGARGEVRVGPNQELVARNPTKARTRLQLIRGNGRDDALMATTLTTMPTFRRRMGHQVVSPTTRIATRRVALLFTDLSGSTALYDNVGDAEAWAFVRDHFEVLRTAIEAHHGHVVKTAGDAVMAAFDSAGDALAAALDLRDAFATWVVSRTLPEPVGIKVGVHVGPALVVHSEAWGLDWFGQTVNIAARVQGQAGGGEVVWTSAVQESTDAVRLLAERAIEPDSRSATLKGVSGTITLWSA